MILVSLSVQQFCNQRSHVVLPFCVWAILLNLMFWDSLTSFQISIVHSSSLFLCSNNRFFILDIVAFALFCFLLSWIVSFIMILSIFLDSLVFYNELLLLLMLSIVYLLSNLMGFFFCLHVSYDFCIKEKWLFFAPFFCLSVFLITCQSHCFSLI